MRPPLGERSIIQCGRMYVCDIFPAPDFMNPMNRREAIGVMATGVTALTLGSPATVFGQPSPHPNRLGIVIYALSLHQANQYGGRRQGLSPALAFLEECRRLGASGIQFPFGSADAPHLGELRRRAERYEMDVEASVNPPRREADLERFERDVRLAQEAGATLARTVIIPGRRYEQFRTLEAFKQAEAQGLKSLQLAEPVLRRRHFRLAVENHKDQRIAERLALLKQLSSEYIGLCVDVGNSFTLIEEPLDTARAFAPWAFTVHIKDQAVREYEDGFLYADVPLGEGFIDLPAIVKLLREANPAIRFNLELITRDALQVPILKDGFWTTLRDVPATDLARIMRVLRTRSHPDPFPIISQLPADQQMAAEQHNVEQSLAYAREKLGL